MQQKWARKPRGPGQHGASGLGVPTSTGAAVHVTNGGSLTMTSCIVRDNVAKYGGGVYMVYYYMSGSSVATFSGCSIYENTAQVHAHLFAPATPHSLFQCRPASRQFLATDRRLLPLRRRARAGGGGPAEGIGF